MFGGHGLKDKSARRKATGARSQETEFKRQKAGDKIQNSGVGFLLLFDTGHPWCHTDSLRECTVGFVVLEAPVEQKKGSTG